MIKIVNGYDDLQVYISKIKTIATCLILVFSVQLAVIPADILYAAGCLESAAKSAITTGVVAGGFCCWMVPWAFR